MKLPTLTRYWVPCIATDPNLVSTRHKTTITKALAFGTALLSSMTAYANTDVPFSVTANSPSFTISGGSLGGGGCGIVPGLHRYDTVTFRVNGSGNHNVSTLSLTGMGGG
jgi:hypothetical protein